MPTKRAGSAEADPSREGEEGRRDTPPPPPPKGRRWGDKHSHAPQPNRGARPGAFRHGHGHRHRPSPAARRLPHRGLTEDAPSAPPAPAAPPAPKHPHRHSSDPTGTGVAAPTPLLRPLLQQRSALATTPLLLLQTCRHRTASRRHRLGTAPAPSMLGVVVPSHRLPRPAARRLFRPRTTAPRSLSGEEAVDGHQR